MKHSAFFIFISVVMVIYFSANYYIFIRGWQSLPAGRNIRFIYCTFFILLVIAYIASKFLERTPYSAAARIFSLTGSFWLAAMLYFTLFIALIDLAKLLNHWFHFFPTAFSDNYQNPAFIAAISVCLVVFGLLIGGAVNAAHPVVRKIHLDIHKKAGHFKKLNMAVVSDVHVGSQWNQAKAEKLLANISKLHPDIIIFAGDLVDEVLSEEIQNVTSAVLKNLKAPLGVFAITGNHEYIGGIQKSAKYIQSLGFTLLRDSVLKIEDGFYLIGREDRDISRFSGNKRKGIDELLKSIDQNLPLIMLDHQPFHLQEVAMHDIDLQVSGHTHHGQIWPFNYITSGIFELSWGYKKIKNTNFYVSNGYGTWGPPVRIGNRPEVVLFEINFD